MRPPRRAAAKIDMRPLALWLSPLPCDAAAIARAAGFTVTTVLGRRAAVWCAA